MIFELFLFFKLCLKLKIIIISKKNKPSEIKLIAIHLYKFKKKALIFSLPLNFVELLTKYTNINKLKTKKTITIKLLKITSKIIDVDEEDLMKLKR